MAQLWTEMATPPFHWAGKVDASPVALLMHVHWHGWGESWVAAPTAWYVVASQTTNPRRRLVRSDAPQVRDAALGRVRFERGRVVEATGIFKDLSRVAAVLDILVVAQRRAALAAMQRAFPDVAPRDAATAPDDWLEAYVRKECKTVEAAEAFALRAQAAMQPLPLPPAARTRP